MTEKEKMANMDQQIFVRSLDPGVKQAQIARDLGVHRSTVTRHLQSPNYPENTKEVRELAREAFKDGFEPEGGVYKAFAAIVRGLANANKSDKEDWTARAKAADSIRAVYGMDAPKEQKVEHAMDGLTSEELLAAVEDAVDDDEYREHTITVPCDTSDTKVHQEEVQGPNVGQEEPETDSDDLGTQ